MNPEQLWSAFFMAAIAGKHNAGDVAASSRIADQMLLTHFARWPDGEVAERQRERDKWERENRD